MGRLDLPAPADVQAFRSAPAALSPVRTAPTLRCRSCKDGAARVLCGGHHRNVNAAYAVRSSSFMAQIRVTVDRVEYVDDVEPRMLLVQYLRERLGKAGTVIGCATRNCGPCTVHLDGRSVNSSPVLAVPPHGGDVATILSLA